MVRKTICLITNWYPTKENPFQGLFFKEQAFALAEYYDFLIVHYYENIKKKPWERTNVGLVNEENNTKEYIVQTWIPLRFFCFDAIENIRQKHSGKARIEGVGKFVSERRIAHKKKTLVDVFDNYIREQFDVLYCVDAQKEAFHLQCLAEHYGKPYVIGEHAPVPWPGDVLNQINKDAIEKADLFFAISNDKIRQMMLLNIQLPKTVYIGNMVDERKLAIKEENHGTKTILIMAAYSFYKNYNMFISVMNRLTQITDHPFKILIVGYAANKGYAQNASELERKISESSFCDMAEMIPSVPHSEVGEILRRADAFVMTSVQEGQPVSAMEAACCGLPVFSTRCGGVEDYIDEKMGRIYAVADVEGMAHGLKQFIEGDILFDAAYIRERTISLFGLQAFIGKFYNAIDEVIMNESAQHHRSGI